MLREALFPLSAGALLLAILAGVMLAGASAETPRQAPTERRHAPEAAKAAPTTPAAEFGRCEACGRSTRTWNVPPAPARAFGELSAAVARVPRARLTRAAARAALRRAEWASEHLDAALCVMGRESDFRVAPAHEAGDPHGGSDGLMQVNGWWALPRSAGGPYPSFAPYDRARGARDVDYHLRYARAIFESEGWGAWGTARACGLV